MSIIYDGLLQTYVAEWIRDAADEFGHAIEMSSLPPNWNEWIKENLEDYTASSENCMGQKTIMQSKVYCLVRRHDNTEPLFLFLKTQKETDAVLQGFPDLVVNKSPFRTVI